MTLEPARYEYYKKQLAQLLKTATDSIKTHCDTVSSETPRMRAQAAELLLLSERYNIAAREQKAAAKALLPAYHLVYSALQHSVCDLDKSTVGIAAATAEFERCCADLEAEQQQPCSAALTVWLPWLRQTSKVLESQAKYLEMHTYDMLPSLIHDKVVKAFQAELELPEHHDADIRMGLARATQLPKDLLKAD